MVLNLQKFVKNSQGGNEMPKGKGNGPGRPRKVGRPKGSGKTKRPVGRPKKKRTYKSKPKVLVQKRMTKVPQTAFGKSQDRELEAMRPGRRISKNKRKYTETRSNRSDTGNRHY